jgi:hypothetical protein
VLNVRKLQPAATATTHAKAPSERPSRAGGCCERMQ